MKTQCLSQAGPQRGVGLIEMMIALTIGLVLLIGVAQYFIGMRQTAQSAQKMSAIQNQQRMAMYFLHTAVSGAGYFTADPNNIILATTSFPILSPFTLAGQTLIGSTAGTNLDSLTVRFGASALVGGAAQGCSASLTAGSVYTDVFSVSNGYLTCVETNNTAGTPATTVNLIGDATTGVSGMQLMYGVDSQSSGSVQQYLTAAQVTTGTLWANVKTVEITLTFVNPLAGQPGQPATVTLRETVPYMNNI